MQCQKRYAVSYLALFGFLTLSSLFFSWSQSPLNGEGVSLGDVGLGEILITNGIDEKERISLKLSQAVSSGATDVGLFGSHALKYLSGAALGLPTEEFMNYFVLHIGLPGILDMLKYLEEEDALPETILVQLHHPHSSNWEHIMYRIWDMPALLYFHNSDLRWTKRVRNLVKMTAASLREGLDARHLTFHLFEGAGRACARRSGVISIQSATKESVRPLEHVPESRIATTMRKWGLVKSPPRLGAPCGQITGLQSDGSVVVLSPAQKLTKTTPRNSTNPLAKGSENTILTLIGGIANVAWRNKRQVFFFVPPMYEHQIETNRSQMLDAIISLARKEKLPVIDHRSLRSASDLFISNLHPSPAYLGRLLLDVGIGPTVKTGSIPN